VQLKKTVRGARFSEPLSRSQRIQDDRDPFDRKDASAIASKNRTENNRWTLFQRGRGPGISARVLSDRWYRYT